jgi:plastocyanin
MLALWLAVVPSASAGNPCFHDYEIPALTSGTDTEIKLLPCAFAPTITTVPVGSKVTFFNGPAFSHLVTGAGQAWGSPDVEIRPGASVAYTFDNAGMYPYACVLHPGMSGVIVVGDVASAIGGGSVAAGVGGAGGPATSGGRAGAAEPGAAETALTAKLNPFVAFVGVVGVIVGALMASALIWLTMRRRHRTSPTTPAPMTPSEPI